MSLTEGAVVSITATALRVKLAAAMAFALREAATTRQAKMFIVISW